MPSWANMCRSLYCSLLCTRFAAASASAATCRRTRSRTRPSLPLAALLASLIGTTGAAMVLIRPLLETNSERKHVRHTVVFFIFVVCNCGGCLLPIGDPPLFLGYLEGVEFLWTLSLWKEWAFVNLSLLAIYYCWDQFWAYPRESKRDIAADERRVRKLQFRGLWLNMPLLFGVVLAVALLSPGKPIPGTQWHPWLWLREIVQLVLVGLSLCSGVASGSSRQPLYLCRDCGSRRTLPWHLRLHAACLADSRCPWRFAGSRYTRKVLTGLPELFLRCSTTLRLTWCSLRRPKHSMPKGRSQAGVAVEMLAAISLGAVFMGAMTYIGNGPNFMVKSIAEQSE